MKKSAFILFLEVQSENHLVGRVEAESDGSWMWEQLLLKKFKMEKAEDLFGQAVLKTFENSLWRKIIYKCDQRNFASVGAVNLLRHLKSHSEEKTNKCNLCNFASALESNLWNNLKTYLAQMPCLRQSGNMGPGAQGWGPNRQIIIDRIRCEEAPQVVPA